MMDLREFMKDTHCKIWRGGGGGVKCGEGRELGDGRGDPSVY